MMRGKEGWRWMQRKRRKNIREGVRLGAQLKEIKRRRRRHRTRRISLSLDLLESNYSTGSLAIANLICCNAGE